MRLFENQLERDAAVLNADDPEVTRTHAVASTHLSGSAGKNGWLRARSCATIRLFFVRTARRSPLGAARRYHAARRTQCRKRSGRVRGRLPCGGRPSRIATGVKTFEGVEHRLEFVAEIGGVSVLQRFESHQCGRRAQGHRSISRPAHRDSGRQGQRQPVHAAARATSHSARVWRF